MNIEKGKFYRTRDGSKAEVFCTGSTSDLLYAVVGRIWTPEGQEKDLSWSKQGLFAVTPPRLSDEDIVSEWIEPTLQLRPDDVGRRVRLVDGSIDMLLRYDGGSWISGRNIWDVDGDGYVYGDKSEESNIVAFLDPYRPFIASKI